jgi:hypothetical protein
VTRTRLRDGDLISSTDTASLEQFGHRQELKRSLTLFDLVVYRLMKYSTRCESAPGVIARSSLISRKRAELITPRFS